jgi:hypothetical protein
VPTRSLLPVGVSPDAVDGDAALEDTGAVDEAIVLGAAAVVPADPLDVRLDPLPAAAELHAASRIVASPAATRASPRNE